MDTGDKKTVVVVDDMAAILEHAKQILKDDYKVIPCMSAKQALEVIDKRKPDIVLTDINMPDMDGFELLSAIRSNPETKDIPVLFISAEMTSDIEAKGFELGVDDFILKPFSQVTMLKRMANQLALKK